MRAKKLSVLGVAAAAVTAVLVVPAVRAASTTVTFAPVADAFVDAGHANANYGTKPDLKAKNPPKRSFLRFNVQGISGTVASATLRIYVRTNSGVGYDVRDVADDTWGETTITNANAPAPSPTVTASSGAFSSNRYVAVNITPLVTGNGLVSIALTTSSSSEIKLYSKEQGANFAPQLVVSYDPAPTPPQNTSPPTISGMPQEGSTLTASRGAWTGSEPIAYTYQWVRCDQTAVVCTDVTGATATTYALTAGDVGWRMRVRVTGTNSLGSSSADSQPTAVVTARPASDPVIAAAGDIACSAGSAVTGTTCHQQQTSDLLAAGGLDAVLALGDNQYENGELSNFNAVYNPTWGRVKAITHPAVGNHEYQTAGASGYYAYWGAQAGDPSKGYYSFDVGAWHLIALNSNCSAVGGCGAGSPEEQWLRADLQAHTGAACTLAYWHHPRFSSGSVHGSDATYQPFWQALYDFNADVVLVGHEHNYERFAPQTPTGAADPARGIREFVSGTGGKSQYAFGSTKPNSQVRNSATFGVLKLTLHATGYDWQFVPEAGKTFTDSGTTACH